MDFFPLTHFPLNSRYPEMFQEQEKIKFLELVSLWFNIIILALVYLGGRGAVQDQS